MLPYIWHWFFVDEEGEWGTFTPEYQECEQDQFDIGGLIFSQEQYDTLLLWAEAYTFRRKHALGLDAFDYGGEKLLIKQLYVLALEADKQLILDEAERVLYMKDNLKKIS